MLNRFFDQNTIIFCIKGTEYNHSNQINESLSNQLFLLSKYCQFSIFEAIPKIFSISTRNNTSYFNIDMLKEVSPVIYDFVSKNPDENHYFLDINDETNVLNKFELLFQGQTVHFDEDDIPISQIITKLLQIKKCPNFLKPEKLSTFESFYSKVRDVLINQQKFINYLRNPELQTFTIKTNRKEYKCNIFGIYSSNCIKEILKNNPKAEELIFDFDDEYNEFQLICDLFNFRQVDIKSDNMYFLKDIAVKLQINCIIEQVENFINSYENFSEKVDKQQKFIDSIDDLFDLLYNIKIYGITKVKFSIVDSKMSKKIEGVQELAAFILQVIKSNIFLQKEMADLLIELNKEASDSNKLNILIPFIVEKLMNFYMPQPSFKTERFTNENIDDLNFPIKQKSSIMPDESNRPRSKFVFSFIRILYNRGIISKDMINEKLKYYDYYNKYLNAFFLPEIIEIDPKKINTISRQINYSCGSKNLFSLYINSYLPDKIHLYKKMLDNFEPDDELTKSLQIDDVDTFQSIIISNQIDITKATVPYNIFDDLDKEVNFINYAALYGSIRCFKYLLLNDAKIVESSFYFAVKGGNTEIIKIVDQKLTEENDRKNTDIRDDLSIILLTIVMHRNDLFDWIFEKLFVSKGKLGKEINNLAEASAFNGNLHALIELVDKGIDISQNKVISISAKNGFYKLTRFLLKLIDQNKVTDLINDDKLFNPESSVNFENLSIFKLFCKQMNDHNLNNAILHAINMNYIKIIEYYLDHLNELDNESISESFIKDALCKSFMIKSKNDKLFNLLFDNFLKLKPKYFSHSLFMQLLKSSCEFDNFLTTKKITELILKEKTNEDLTVPFIEASSSGSTDICNYFIDKKVCINYYNLLDDISKLCSIDVKIFEVIFNNITPNLRYKCLECIKYAIAYKNKQLIEFLLKKNAPVQISLFAAVFTHDAEIVNLILKYNNKPSFINQKLYPGTALHVASAYHDVDIVKLLLSIPGINPGLLNIQGKSPLSIAIECCDLEIFDAILDFYGDDIHSDFFVLHSSLMEINNSLMIKRNPIDKIIKMIDRFIEIKSIDQNIYNLSRLLITACKYNYIDIVKSLFKLDKIDLNIYDLDSYDTPLIIAIKNNFVELAKLLIENPKTDVNLKNMKDETPLSLAFDMNLLNVVNIIIKNEKFDPIESNANSAFYKANDSILKILISSNLVDLNCVLKIPNRNYEGRAFSFLALENKTDIITFILNQPALKVDEMIILDAIFVTVCNNNVVLFKTLIKLVKNDVNIKNYKGESIFTAAVMNNSGDILDEIFQYPNFDSNNYQIVDDFINLLCNNKDASIEIMDKILNYDKDHSHLIDLNKLLHNGKSFFTSITNIEYDDIPNFLLENGADPNLPDKFGVYPLEHAIKIQSLPFVTSLVNSNKINFSQLPNGDTYLHISARNGNTEIFTFLLETNLIDMNAENMLGNTVLIEACKTKCSGIIDLLFTKDNLDYLHCNKYGIDALSIIKTLPLDEYNEAKQSQKTYHSKITSLIQ